MELILAVFLVFALVMSGMAIGLLRGRPIKGTCGGIASLKMGSDCDICGGNRDRCEDEQRTNKSATPYYSAAGSPSSGTD